MLHIPESLAVRHDTEDLVHTHFRQACLEGHARRVYLDSSRQRLGPDDLPELMPLAHPSMYLMSCVILRSI